MGETIRVGRISNVDYVAGMASIYYEDKTAAVTAMLPMLSNGEYNFPNIGDLVLVSHLSNDTTQGVILGTFWNAKNKPEVPGVAFFKRIGQGAYIIGQGGDILFQTEHGKFSVNQILALEKRVKALEDKI